MKRRSCSQFLPCHTPTVKKKKTKTKTYKELGEEQEQITASGRRWPAALEPRKGEISGGRETKGPKLSPLHSPLKPCPQGQVALGRALLTTLPSTIFPSLPTAEKSHVVFLTQTSSQVASVQVLQVAETKRELGEWGISWKRWLSRQRGRSNGRQGEPSDHSTLPIHWKERGKEVELSRKSLKWYSSVPLLSRVHLFVTPWTATRQASLSVQYSPRKILVSPTGSPGTRNACERGPVRTWHPRCMWSFPVTAQESVASALTQQWILEACSGACELLWTGSLLKEEERGSFL